MIEHRTRHHFLFVTSVPQDTARYDDEKFICFRIPKRLGLWLEHRFGL